MELLQLDDVSDRLSNERRLELFFESGIIGFAELSDPVGDSDDKREGSFKKQYHSSQLSQYVSPSSIKDSGFIDDFEVFIQGAVGAL